ncbi:MAG TPA: D-alanyl-D-alanine carboxypeptidase family protein [Acidimicrobiales bacterium]
MVIAILTPATSGAQESDTQAERERVQAEQAEIALEIDALEAEDAEVRQALADLEENVSAHEAEVVASEEAVAVAEAELADAEAAVAELERRIVELDRATDELVVAAFTDPPVDQALEAFRAESMSDAVVKQSLLEMQAEDDADLMEQLDRAREDLVSERRALEEAAKAADQRRAEAADALAEMQAALAQQQAFADELEERLNARLAEAESLKQYDAELAEKIEAEQAELARNLRALQDAEAPTPDPPPSTIDPAPGGLATVSCPSGGEITVAGSIAGDVQALLDAAAADGLALCGWGYRNPEEQIELRREHCGTSNYAIYEMPSSQCSPPTAIPGTSQHEKGLAIDFTCGGDSISSQGSSCFQWLAANAANYGLHNLPSEPWHWSTTGG